MASWLAFQATWIRLSANQGLDIAQNYIGNIYEIGLGVTQDYSEALKWYTLSAEQGYDFAQNRLGNLYSMGLGVLQDNVTAHMWYNIASANGHEGAGERRDEISHKMTNEDISIAAKKKAAEEAAKKKAAEEAAKKKAAEERAAGNLSSFESLNRLENLCKLASTDRAVSLSNFDTDPMLLAAPNQWVDLKSGVAYDPDPSILISKAIATDFCSRSECPNFEAFVNDIFEGD